MGNTFSMQASHKLGFLHHIRLVPLFSSILGGILLLFALSAGWQAIFCYRPIAISVMSRTRFRYGWDYPTALTTYVPHVSI